MKSKRTPITTSQFQIGFLFIIAVFFFFQYAFFLLSLIVRRWDNFQIKETTVINENINLAYIAAGKPWVRYAFHSHLKSVLINSKTDLNLHIISNHDVGNDIKMYLDTWNLTGVNYKFYDLEKFIHQVEWIPTHHYSKSYAFAKLLIPDIIDRSVEKVAVLDIDTFFQIDVVFLWKQFDKMRKYQIFGLTENLSDWYLNKNWRRSVWPAKDRGFNTGVMLMDLKKLRAVKWKTIWRTTAEEHLRIHGSTTMADQDIFNAVLARNPEWVYTMSCKFNYQFGSASDAQNLCPHDDPYILHFNSENKSMSKNIKQQFQNMYKYIDYQNGEWLKITRNNFQSPGLIDSLCESYVPNNSVRIMPNALGKPNWNLLNMPCVVTQLSIDRISNLLRLAKHWPYSISVAVYGDDEELATVLDNFRSMNRSDIALHLVFKSSLLKTFPINFLRNVAINYTNAETLLHLDADFIVLGDLNDLACHATNMKDNEALVLPAFEMTENIYNFDRTIVPFSKQDVINGLKSHKVRVFRQDIWPKGHNATNISKWVESNDTYSIEWEMYYEPFILMKKSVTPSYDERFQGFGWNKVVHIIDLVMKNITLQVVPSTYLLHQQHSPSKDLLRFRSDKQFQNCQKRLKLEFIRTRKVPFF